VPEDLARPLGGRRRTEATALPSWIKPQLTKLVDQPPDGPDWLHEIKFDGYGCMPGWTGVRSGC
jgi:ATP-dependent DNA ligase